MTTTEEERMRLLIHAFGYAAEDNDLPETAALPPLPASRAHPQLLEVLGQVARQLNLGVADLSPEYPELHGAIKGCDILVDRGDRFETQAYTLLHELAHVLDGPDEGQVGAAQFERELVAETVALLVGQKLYLQLDPFMVVFVKAHGGCRATLDALAERILAVTVELEVAIVKVTDRWPD